MFQPPYTSINEILVNIRSPGADRRSRPQVGPQPLARLLSLARPGNHRRGTASPHSCRPGQSILGAMVVDQGGAILPEAFELGFHLVELSSHM